MEIHDLKIKAVPKELRPVLLKNQPLTEKLVLELATIDEIKCATFIEQKEGGYLLEIVLVDGTTEIVTKARGAKKPYKRSTTAIKTAQQLHLLAQFKLLPVGKSKTKRSALRAAYTQRT